MMDGGLQALQDHYDLDGASTEDIAEAILRRFDQFQPILPSQSTAVTKEYEPTPGHKMKKRPVGLTYKKRKKVSSSDDEVSSSHDALGLYSFVSAVFNSR